MSRFERTTVSLWISICLLSLFCLLTPRVLEASSDKYELSRMEAFSWVLLQIKQDYVDPSRVDPVTMLEKTLEYIERRVPDVEIQLKDGEARLQVGGKHSKLRVGKPATVWEMNYNLQPVFKFISENLESGAEPERVEFAAINGMLSTLDPHSNLLPPEIYREMQLKTTGEFGGLGIRISVRRGMLTIISPLPDTPAARLGLKAMDQIVRIDDQSTVNMPLDEAVNLLRGKAGSKVVVWIMRKGWAEPQKYVITRQTIRVRSIESELLDGKVGYIAIRDFSRHTGGDLLRHLSKLKRDSKGLRGLVLDLRNNAGGLMKSAVQAADLFLDRGIIVATVAYSEDSTPKERVQKAREEQRADEEGADLDLPIVVLVNSGSASASEILAGALKNLDRAVVMGEQTFGKGTVQILNDRVPESVEGACLKLTMAEYLIPGDVSIQEVGVTPDIKLEPMLLDPEDLQVFAKPERFREADIEAHLKKHRKLELKPAETVRYVFDMPKKKEEKDDEPPLPDEGFKEDFEIRLARDYLLAIKTPRGSAMMDEGADFLRKVQQAELAKMAKRFKKLKVDWSLAAGIGALGKAEFALIGEGVGAKGQAKADSKVTMKLTVQNSGKAPFFRLRAESRCEHRLYDNREFLFGRVNPGQSKTWEVPVKVPQGAWGRTDDLRFEFFAEGSKAPENLETRITTEGLPRPAFAFSWWVADEKGNGDGLIQPGEQVELKVRVTNRGAGKAMGAKGLLQNKAGKDLFLVAGGGRLKLEEIEPGASKTDSFRFRVPAESKRKMLPVEITLWDSAFGVTQVAKLELPLDLSKSRKVRKIKLVHQVKRSRAEVRGGADLTAPLVGFASKNLKVRLDRQLGPWFRIVGRKGPAGWIHTENLSKAKGKAAPIQTSDLVAFEQYSPPRIELKPVPAYLEKGGKVRLRGRVLDDDADLRDVAVWVGSKKIHMVSGTDTQNPRNVPFDVELDLEPGANFVTVMAREGERYAVQQAKVITLPGGLDHKKDKDESGEAPPIGR